LQILFVLPYLPSLIRVRPYQFLRQLVGHHEVTLLATDSVRPLRELIELRDLCRRVEVVPMQRAASLRSCLGAALHGEPLQAAVCHSPALDSRLRAVLRESHFDVVHIEHLRAARLGRLVPAGVATVFDAVDSISLLLERTLRASHSIQQRLLAAVELRRTRAFEARAVACFDRTMVTSPDDRQAFCRLAPAADVAVVPNGVDLQYFRPLGGPREPATLILTGKMSYHANVTAALHFVRHIWPRVRATQPQVRLSIVGSNPPREVRALADDPAINVTGYVPDLRQYLGRAAVAVCPVTVKVGIQNKLLEAMAMGVPVVSTWPGIQGLAAVPGRDLLVADSPAEFADNVCQLLADRSLADELAQAGRRYVQSHHRWLDVSRSLEVLYAEAIERRRARRP
jgi:sugar transferase (PEP-CTERM/EpsH1 system associated)